VACSGKGAWEKTRKNFFKFVEKIEKGEYIPGGGIL
jgi:hypothetical protein